MRGLFSFVLGIISGAMGLLIALPTITYESSIWVLQMLLSEFSWISAALGIGAVGLGAAAPRKSRWGIFFGAFGLLWSLIPYWQIRQAAKLNETAMREGLGQDYDRQLLPAFKSRIRQRRWSPETSFGTRSTRELVEVERDVVYQATPQRPLALDIYKPRVAPAAGTQFPAIITIHGGAWRYGNKGEVFIPHHQYLASLGFVVFDIQYRLSEQAAFPAALEDIRAAIRWVKRYAPVYQVDPERVGLLGRSAGGHLALLAAYRADEPGGEGTAVQAVVGIYPPTDLRLWYSDESSDITRFLGGTSKTRSEAYVQSSPLVYAHAGVPPTLLVQGYRDDLVMPSHSELLHNALQGLHVPVAVLRIPWARHGFDALMTGLGAQIVQYDVDRFLGWALYRQR